MIESNRSREILSQFLKTRRARLRPEDVGLPSSLRRRLPGLRREEVAALAGLGDTWYGLFESGKNITVSDRVVDSVGDALRLDSDERGYLQSLVQGEIAPQIDFSADRVTPSVEQTVHAIASAPAFVIGPRLDYLALNRLTQAIHRIPHTPEPYHRNLMLRVFVDPNATSLYPQWEDTARRAVSKFRRNYGTHVGNASFETLIAELSAQSSEFCRLWEIHDVGTLHDPITSELVHPVAGSFHYRLQAFAVPDTLAQTLVVMLPQTPADEAVVATLRRFAPSQIEEADAKSVDQ